MTLYLPPASASSSTKQTYKIAAPGSKAIELLGRAFFAEYEQAGAVLKASSETDAEYNVVDDDDAKSPPNQSKSVKPKSRAKAGMLKLDDNLQGVDLYALLDVAEDANDKDLKNAYRTCCKNYHPDKIAGSADEDEKNKHFVKIQQAYDTLMDPVTRRKFDSSRPFDDAIPKEADAALCKSDQEFYDLFAPVFKRNAKWSQKQPVPELPAPEVTDTATVLAFYKFWTSQYESWRDFDVKIQEEDPEALDDPGKADCREEKRYIERQNARVRQKYMNEESARILKLSETAEKFDSRVKAYLDAEFQRKNAGKIKKEQERLAKLEAEKLAAEEAERKVKEEADKKANEKNAKEQAKQEMKAARRALKDLRATKMPTVCPDQLQEMSLKLGNDKATVEDLTAKLLGLESEAATTVVWELMKGYGIDPIVYVPCEEPEVVVEEKPVNNKKGKKNNKKNTTIEDVIDEAENQIDHELEKARSEADAKKKSDLKKKQQAAAEKAKKDAEKKAAEKAKKDAVKAEKEVANKAALQDEAKKKQEEMRQKQKAESEAAKKAAEDAKLNEARLANFTRFREEQFRQYDKMESLEEAKEAAEPIQALLRCIPGNDIEVRLDTAAVLMANYTNLHFFEIAKRPTLCQPKDISNALRNKLKKVRQGLRDFLQKYYVEDEVHPDDAKIKELLNGASLSDDPKVDKILKSSVYPEEMWMNDKLSPEEAAAGGNNADNTGASKKKKNKTKKKDDEEDLDQIFADLGMEAGGKKKKNKK